jgi:NADP oxidoreductase coenzyme F420-dependent
LFIPNFILYRATNAAPQELVLDPSCSQQTICRASDWVDTCAFTSEALNYARFFSKHKYFSIFCRPLNTQTVLWAQSSGNLHFSHEQTVCSLALADILYFFHPMINTTQHIAFIGGGNMASAILGGLMRHGMPVANMTVVEPNAETAASLPRWRVNSI